MRNSADIVIHKVDGTEITVPVTAEARRRWRLMEEDSITLSFLTEKAISFAVGDYVEILSTDYTNREISGTFYITEPIQIPDMTNGVYKYTVRFDNGYIGWKNLLFQLTHNDNGYITRKETDWVLTQNLESHVREVIKNLFVLGIPCNKYCLGRTIVKYENGIFSNDGVIDYPFESAEEYESYKTITYTGTDIFSAIKNGICDAYKCEFWMYDDILCLGKCEIGEAIDFKVAPIDTDKSYFNSSVGKFFTNKDERILVNDGTGAINVESLRPSKSNDKYANRIYAFGSTKNIPYSYRKQLVFTCNESDGGLYRDNLRRLYSPMVKGVTDDREINSFSVVSGYRIENGQVIPAPGWGMTKDESVLVGETVTLDIAARESTSGFLVFGFDGTSYQSLGASSAESQFYEFVIPNGIESFTVVFKLSNYLGLSASVAGITRTQIQVVYNGSRYTAVFNADTSGGWIEFYPTPYGFGIGSKFTIPTEYLNVSEIKDSYYSSEYGDPSSLSHVGDSRLKLPQYAVGDYSGKGFVGDDNIPAEQLVEKVVFFEGVYPQTALRITDIRIDSGMVTSETHADGSSSRYEASKYTIKAKLITDGGLVNFPFDRSMIISGQELQIKFLTKEEEESYGPVSDSPHKLAGMTFSVKWNQSDKSYTIRWNQDYGAQIPSEVLCPTIGDSFVLIGWKVNAMSTLGLLNVAELRLLDKAKKYAEAVKEAQATYDCNMMSGWNNKILLPGQKVKVHDETQENGYYTSRVIGYEVKLDIPEDSPIYTIGNTEAYSRLRELEKSLEIGEGNVSVTGDNDTAEGGGTAYQQGGGGSILDVWRSLTNNETLDSFDEGTEINIDHLPLIPVEKISGGMSFFEEDESVTIGGKHPIKLKSDYAGINLQGKRLYLADGVYLEYDGDSAGVKLAGAGFWTESYAAAGGIGSSGGGGGGASLLDMWVSLRDNDPNEDYYNWKVNAGHLPLGSGFTIDQQGNINVIATGSVSSVAGVSPVDGDIQESSLKAALGLKDAAYCDVGQVSSGNAGLVSGGAVYSAINDAISSAIKFQGITTTPLTDGSTTSTIVIDGETYTAKKGDEVIYGGKEFLWTGSKWQQLGDEESWALKTIKIEGKGYLIGGGNLTANREIDINDETKVKIDHGESAYNRTNWDNYFGIDSNGDIYVKMKTETSARNFYGYGSIAAGGIGQSGGGGGGLVESIHRYNELGGSFNDNDNDVFNAYTVNKINTDLGARITSLEEGAAVSIVTTGTGNVVSSITKSGTTITVTKGINALTTVPKATDSIIGGFQTGYSESGKNYAVKMSGNKAYVSVPWVEYSLPLAADGTRGGIQVGFSQSGKNYPVQLSNEKAYVNVPWANNTYRITLNGTERGTTSGTSLGSFYAPTSSGTSNQVLLSGGSNTSPSWTNQSNLSVGTAAKLGSSTVGDTSKPIYLNSGTATECSTYAGGTAVTLNGTSKGANTASFYAPTESGTAGYALISGGNNTAPSWTSAIRVSGSNVGIACAASSSFALNVNGDSQITGDLRLQGSSDYGNHLYFGDGSYAYLYEDTDDHLTICGNKGIKLDVGSSYGIEFGNGVLKWDSGNNAWHLEGNFYADGFVTAGGIGSENTQLVTIAGNQTITGVKTFSSALTLTSNLSVGGDATITGASTFTDTATFNGLATFNGKINIGVQSGYVGITSSNNTIYIQHAVSRDLILTDGSSSHTIIGAYVSPGSYKLYVNGSAKASAWDTSSDRRLKRDIREVSAERAIDVLMRLNPVEWVWNEKNATLEGTRCAGLIAQDTKGVLPFAINDGAEYLGMNYNVFHAYEIAGLQNHEGRIKALEKENAELKAKVKQLETR